MGSKVSKSLISPPATPRSFPGTFPFCQEHIICFAAGGLQTLCRDPQSASCCKVCFQNGAGFHFLSRSTSAFVTYVNLLWKNHRKADYCPDTVFRQTSNVSPGSECGISDGPPLCQWVIRAIVVTMGGCACGQLWAAPSPGAVQEAAKPSSPEAELCWCSPVGAQHPQAEHGHVLQQLLSSQTHTLLRTRAPQLQSCSGTGICFCTAEHTLIPFRSCGL